MDLLLVNRNIVMSELDKQRNRLIKGNMNALQNLDCRHRIQNLIAGIDNKIRVDCRYRRRMPSEKQQLQVFLDEKKDLQNRVDKLTRDEIKRLQDLADFEKQYNESENELNKLNDGKSSVSQDNDIHKNIDELMNKLKDIDCKIGEMEDSNEPSTGNDPEVVNRDISNIYGDMLRVSGWGYMNSGGKSGDTIQYFEQVQQKIERGELPSSNHHATIKGYWLWSKSRNRPVMIEKVSSNPSRWRHKFYYKPCTLEDALREFRKMGGTEIDTINVTKYDKLEFADVH